MPSSSRCSGCYRDGEFVYQDFLYDDHGANGGQRDPGDPHSGDDTFSAPNGTYTYPTGPGYAQNAADLVELRVRPLANATAFRLTLNTMLSAHRVAATIAIGSSPAPVPFPRGANATAPAALFLTVHGPQADLLDATGAKRSPAPQVSVFAESRQIEVRVPHPAWNPGSGTVRLAAGVGLWDEAGGRYLVPAGAATATTPGGAGALPAPPAFFNVAFRSGEPYPDVGNPTNTVGNPASWRDQQQGTDLRTGDLSRFHADVDFDKLAAGTRDDGGVPKSGPINRILVSHFETKQGVDFGYECGSSAGCLGELRGRLVPYALYVPKKTPARYGFAPLMHSLGANYNQFDGRLRDLPLRDAVPRPVRQGPADGRPARHRRVGAARGPAARRRAVQHVPPARLVAEHPVPVVERVGRRARPLRRRTRAGRRLRPARLPLRVRHLRAGRAPHARRPRSVRARGGVPRRRARGPRPAARHLRPQPEDGLPRGPDPGRPRLLAVGDRAARRRRRGAAGHGRRALRGFGVGDPKPGATQNGAGSLAGGNLGALA